MMPQKARKATILLGHIPLDVYQMADGHYELYGKGITDAITEPANAVLRFVNGNSPEALQCKDFTPCKLKMLKLLAAG